MTISTEGRRKLLEIARNSISSGLSGVRPEPVRADSYELGRKLGVFVTLRKDGELRGCIGRFSSSDTLTETVQQMAQSAAFEDPRFPRLSSSELEDLDIEISVLSPMEKVTDPYSEIEPGKHGVYIKKGFRSGTFLPEVATDHNMSLEEFLSTCASHKAGLPPDSWKNDPEVEIYTYTSEHFSEHELKS